MNYDVEGATTVSFLHANFGSDSGANLKLQKSIDSGATWTDIEPAMTSFGTSGKRINIDDFTISK